jgi:hypothetical protein
MCPKRRQTMLFSATMTEQIDELVKLSLNKPIRLEAVPSLKRPATLTEEYALLILACLIFSNGCLVINCVSVIQIYI